MNTIDSPQMHSLEVMAKANGIARQKRQRHGLLAAALLGSDALALLLAFQLAQLLRFRLLPYYAEVNPAQNLVFVLALLPFFLIVFASQRLYDRKLIFGGLREYVHVITACTLATGLTLIATLLLRDAVVYSRGWLLLAWIFAIALALLERFAFRRLIYALRARGRLLSPALIVGANAEGRALAEHLQQWSTSGLQIAGVVDSTLPPGTSLVNGLAVRGGLDQLEQLVDELGIEELIIAPTALVREELIDLFMRFNSRPDVNLRLSTGLFEILNTGLEIEEMAYLPLIQVKKNRISGIDRVLKAILDYTIALLALLLAWPLLLGIALWVKFDSPGPVIHRRRVMGANVTQFDAFKFRTMVLNGDELLKDRPDLQQELSQNFKLKDDPRLTRAGRILRKFSLDELPQLFNILLGQMSVVGPRMISPPEMEKYGSYGMNLLTVKPGITGLWQISGRSDTSYAERVNIDMQYIRNWSIWIDLMILLKTVPAVLQRRGAY